MLTAMTSTDQAPTSALATRSRPFRTASPLRPLDGESQTWIDSLSADAPDRVAAVERLHALLLKASRFEVERRRDGTPHLRDDDDIAQQAADDALVALLSKLEDFRGESRFTTWAYKFALLETGSNIRKRAWQRREVTLAPEDWARIADDRTTPERTTQTQELFAVLTQAIRRDLSSQQRDVLLATTLNDVPIDVLAGRLNTTRAAIYKTIHDARRNLREALGARGLSVGELPEATSP